jgi:hypothetical protein
VAFPIIEFFLLPNHRRHTWEDLAREEPELFGILHEILFIGHAGVEEVQLSSSQALAPPELRAHHIFPYKFQSEAFTVGLAFGLHVLIHDVIAVCQVRETTYIAGLQCVLSLLLCLSCLVYECGVSKRDMLDRLGAFALYVHNAEHGSQQFSIKQRYVWMQRVVRSHWQCKALKQPCRVFFALFFYWYSITAWKITHEANTTGLTLTLTLTLTHEANTTGLDRLQCDFQDVMWLGQWAGWVLASLFFLLFGLLPRYRLMPQAMWEYDNVMITGAD